MNDLCSDLEHFKRRLNQQASLKMQIKPVWKAGRFFAHKEGLEPDDAELASMTNTRFRHCLFLSGSFRTRQYLFLAQANRRNSNRFFLYCGSEWKAEYRDPD